MGANPYCYFAAYDADVARALQALRQLEFASGRYDPALQAADPPTYTFEQNFPPDERFPSPGAQHASIEDALAAGMESGSGTGSILDIVGSSAAPQMLCVSPSTHECLMATFATSQPTHAQALQLVSRDTSHREQLTRAALFWDEIGRGECRYFVVFEGGAAAELCFAGMSLD